MGFRNLPLPPATPPPSRRRHEDHNYNPVLPSSCNRALRRTWVFAIQVGLIPVVRLQGSEKLEEVTLRFCSSGEFA